MGHALLDEPAADARKRLTAPERQSAAVLYGCAARVPGRECAPAVGEMGFEDLGVKRTLIYRDQISGAAGLDQLSALGCHDLLAQSGDADLYLLTDGCRWLLIPDGPDQAVLRDHAVRSEQQHRHDRLLARPADVDRLILIRELEWPQNAKLHMTSCSL